MTSMSGTFLCQEYGNTSFVVIFTSMLVGSICHIRIGIYPESSFCNVIDHLQNHLVASLFLKQKLAIIQSTPIYIYLLFALLSPITGDFLTWLPFEFREEMEV